MEKLLQKKSRCKPISGRDTEETMMYAKAKKPYCCLLATKYRKLEIEREGQTSVPSAMMPGINGLQITAGIAVKSVKHTVRLRLFFKNKPYFCFQFLK